MCKINTNTKNYTWIYSENEYKENWKEDIIPIIAPINPNKKERWEKVLNHYGIDYKESVPLNKKNESCYFKSFDELKNENNSEKNSLDLIITADKKLIDISLFYANRTNRNLLVINNWHSVKEIAKDYTVKSILFIMDKKKVNSHKLNLIKNFIYSTSEPIEWGVITGYDIPSISFALAKSLISPVLSNENISIIDALNEEKKNFTKEQINKKLRQDNDILTIVAHGDGAHANLQHKVLCGLTSSSELDFAGKKIPNGCNDKYCKRAQFTKNDFLPAYEIQAKSLVFLSCNGFSVSGDLYPSNLSLVLSASDGFPINILSTTTPESFSSEEVKIFRDLLKDRKSLPEIVNIFNMISNDNYEKLPYILFGDPLVRSFKKTTIRANRAIINKNFKEKEIYLNKNNKSNSIVKLTSNFAILNQELGEELCYEKYREQLLNLIQNVKFLQKHLYSIDYFCQKVEEILTDENSLKSYLHNLNTNIRYINILISKFYEYSNKVFNIRIVNEKDLIFYKIKIEECMKNMYRNISVILANSNIIDKIEPIFSNNYFKERIRSTQKCVRCGVLLNKYNLSSFNPNIMSRIYYDCDNCGFAENHAYETSRLLFNSQPKINNNELTIVISPKLHQTSNIFSWGNIVGKITNKANGETVHKFYKEGNLSDEPLIVNVPLPEKFDNDLHTIKIALVSNFDISINRLRFVN